MTNTNTNNTNNTITTTITALERAFDRVNAQFFAGQLERPIITIQQGAKMSAYGWMTPLAVWHDVDEPEYSWRELNISAEYLNRNSADVFCTLLHECCHIDNAMCGIKDTANRGGRHNRKFADTAESHGMEAYKGDDFDRVGWRAKLTEETLNWYNDNLRGELESALTLYRDGQSKITKTKTSTVIKYVCPCCGGSVRATKAINLRCIDCSCDMVQA